MVLMGKTKTGLALAVSLAAASSAFAAEKEPKYAVLLIDADYTIDDTYDPEKNPCGFRNLEEELRNMREVLHEANNKNIPVFEILYILPSHITYFNSAPFCPYAFHLDTEGNPHFQKYSGGSTVAYKSCETNPLLTALRTEQWERVIKQNSDSFQDTPLHEDLQSQGITDLILMGQNQYDCVYATAQRAKKLGYAVHTSFAVMQSHLSDDVQIDIQIRDSLGQEHSLSTKEVQDFYRTSTHLVPAYDQLPLFSTPLVSNITAE